MSNLRQRKRMYDLFWMIILFILLILFLILQAHFYVFALGLISLIYILPCVFDELDEMRRLDVEIELDVDNNK